MQLNYASFVSRCIAFLIDSIILTFLLVLILIFLIILSYAGKSGLFLFLSLIIAIDAYWLYFFLFENSRLQATPGKLLLGIKIVNQEGAKPVLRQAFFRSFVKFLSVITLNFLFVVCLFTKNRQNIHDFAGKTYVVYKNPEKTSGNSDKIAKPFIIIFLAIQLIYPAAKLLSYQHSGGSWQDFKDWVSVGFNRDGAKLNWQTILLPDAKLSILSPLNFQRNAKEEKRLNENTVISEAVHYKSDFSLLFELDIQYIKFSSDITPKEALDWAINENRGYKYIKLEITDFGINGLHAIQALGRRFGELKYRIIVIPETKISVWVINDKNSRNVREHSGQIIQKMIDSITIESNEAAEFRIETFRN